MKKVLSIILMALVVTAVFVSCDNHKHTYNNTEWKSDADNHWHECTCGEKSDIAAHEFEAVKVDGKLVKRCKVCNYVSDEEITGTLVSTAAELKSALEADGTKTVYLGADIYLKEKIEIGDSKDITLDMNGKTINEDLGEGANAGIITVAGNGKLKITGNGKISHTLNYYENGDGDVITGYLITAMDSAELTIENGSFYAVMGCVRGGKQRGTGEESYKIEIKGGEFESIVKYLDRYWTLNKMDKNSGVNDGTLSVSGGSFVNFNPEKPATNDTPCYLAEGYRVTSETKDSKTIYTVSAKTTE